MTSCSPVAATVPDVAAAPQAQPRERLVRDVMITAPKTLSALSSVYEVRVALADPHVHMVLLTHERKLQGTLIRADLPVGARGDGPALRWSTLSGRTVAPHAPAALLRSVLVRSGLRRLAVVDTDRTLLGMLCLKRSGAGFCSDADVASRATAGTTIDGESR